jgi:FkbM family methyltransferase
MISYAQNLEDVVLNRVFKSESSGFYIDVGAMDPVMDSVTKTFYDRGWSGINIEPNPQFHAALAADRPRDINLNVALGETEEVRPFYVFPQCGLSTFESRFRDHWAALGYAWQEMPCRVTPLAAVCRAHVNRPVNFLKIDAEGWERAVLRSADWKTFRPKVLVIEAVEPAAHVPSWSDWDPFLTGECGYAFTYFDGVNRFYVPQETYEEVRSCFATPVNVLDGFQLFRVIEADRRRADAEAQAAQAAAAVDQLRSELDEQRRHAAGIRQELLQARLWIGRLSEKLALGRKAS